MTREGGLGQGEEVERRRSWGGVINQARGEKGKERKKGEEGKGSEREGRREREESLW